MSIATYAELKSAIADWLDRSDQDAVIPSWIFLAEKDMEQKLRHHKMVIKSYATGAANDGVIALPSDWLEARNIEVDNKQITYQSPDVLDKLRDMNPTSTGQPLYFSFYDSNIEIWPVPTEDYQIEMDYYQKIPDLADQQTGTNWLLEDAPAAYLYGSLLHSALYLRDDERAPAWDKLFQDALKTIQGGSDRATTRGSRLTRKASVNLG